MKINSIEELAALTARVNAGEQPTDEELNAGVEFSRSSRMAISGRAAKPKKKKPSAPVDLASVFKGMMGES